MKKILLLLTLAAVLVAAWWFWSRKNAPPEVVFARAKRERLVSTLNTNGHVEPIEWVAIRAEREGVVRKIHVERGGRVAAGAAVAEMDSSDARAELAAAESRITQASAEIETLQRGGRAAETAEIESSLKRARLDLDLARKEYDSVSRLVASNAATRQEADAAREKVQRAELLIRSLEEKRAALVTPEDRTVAQSRLRDAQAAAELARRRIALGVIRSPIAGTVYGLPARTGAYLSPGDPVAEVGRLERVRVIVYVDEPELGRVEKGMPVSITWDALPGRRWGGTVERLPTEIAALGTRQVGEVVCIIDNPGRELLPGTNINAEIRSQVVDNALTIPKEALRRQSQQAGVLLLTGDRVEWRAVETGISSVTRVQIAKGLEEGDAVALPTERPLNPGDPVRPVAR